MYTANTADTKALKEQSKVSVKAVESKARVLKPTYGVLAHVVRTDKKRLDPAKQAESLEKIRTENAALDLGAKITYVGWPIRNGAKKRASSLVGEFATKD